MRIAVASRPSLSATIWPSTMLPTRLVFGLMLEITTPRLFGWSVVVPWDNSAPHVSISDTKTASTKPTAIFWNVLRIGDLLLGLVRPIDRTRLAARATTPRSQGRFALGLRADVVAHSLPFGNGAGGLLSSLRAASGNVNIDRIRSGDGLGNTSLLFHISSSTINVAFLERKSVGSRGNDPRSETDY